MFITDRGRPAHVLLTAEDYRRLVGEHSILDLLVMPEAAEITFEPPRDGPISRPADCV